MTKRFIALLFFIFCQQVMADDWGCQVALCMANPAGPTALAECVAPMQRLYDALRNKRGWPSCGRTSAPSVAPIQFNNPTNTQSGISNQGSQVITPGQGQQQ